MPRGRPSFPLRTSYRYRQPANESSARGNYFIDTLRYTPRFFSISSPYIPKVPRPLCGAAWEFIYGVAIADVSLSGKNEPIERRKEEKGGKWEEVREQNGSETMGFIPLDIEEQLPPATLRKITRDERRFRQLRHRFSILAPPFPISSSVSSPFLRLFNLHFLCSLRVS